MKSHDRHQAARRLTGYLGVSALLSLVVGFSIFSYLHASLADLQQFNQTLVQSQARVIEQRELGQLIEETSVADQVVIETTQRWTQVIEAAGVDAISTIRNEKPIRWSELEKSERATPSHELHGPLRSYQPPECAQDAWCRNELDAFVLDQLRTNQIPPPTAADSRTLIRRAWFSLTGLPPSPTDVDVWESRVESDWDELVDYLLARPEYGEHLATPWLDVARYADSNGYEEDELRRDAYPYRDFVIWATQTDLPYDDFVRWQVAGDELQPNNPLATAATGFLAAPPLNTFMPQESERLDELDNMISTIGQSMLGTTIACARCHDHFYDAITSEEYFGLAAILQSTKRTHTYLQPDRGAAYWQQAGWAHQYREEIKQILLQRVRDERIEKNQDFTREEKDLLRQPVDPNDARQIELLSRCGRCLLVDESYLDDELEPLPQDRTRYEFLVNELQRLQSTLPPEPPKSLSITGSEVQQLPVHQGGSQESPGETVGPRFIDCLTQVNIDWHQDGWKNWDCSDQPRPRSALAWWMTDTQYGAGALLARVAVNRIWQHHFGVGLVSTSADFGVEGASPSNEALLEWLAQQLVTSDWSQKHIHRLIVNSATWRQGLADNADLENLETVDSSLRTSLQRLTGEMFRDTILSLAGKINRRRYGPAFQPEIPLAAIMYRDEDDIDATWPTRVLDRPEVWRRSIYMLRRRSNPIPILQLFDAPERSQPCVTRQSTTVPTQALLLWNDEFIRAQARHIANQTRLDSGLEDSAQVAERISKLFRLVLQRAATGDEVQCAQQFLRVGSPTDLVHVLLMSNEFWYYE